MPLLAQARRPARGPGARSAAGRVALWHRLFALGAVLAAGFVLAVIAPQLLGIERLAEATRADVIPEMVVEQKRAVWTESLRSVANLVVYAPDAAIRRDALTKAEQLATTLLHGADAEKRAALAQGLAAIRAAAEATEDAARLDREIKTTLAEASAVIGDLSAGLSSIADDSDGTLARLLSEMRGQAPDRRPTRQDLERTLAIATTSRDLLAHLNEGRILLATARSMESRGDLLAAAERFQAIGRHLRAYVSTLRGSAGYRRLPEMTEHFAGLAAVFDRQKAALEAHDQALQASHEAKLQLAALRENLTADAAGTAEGSVATIAERTRQIRTTALLALGAGVLVTAGIGLYTRQKARVLEGVPSTPSGPSDEERRRQEQLARAAELARRYHQAQCNLDYWRDFLGPKLHRTVAAVLRGSPPDDEQPDVEAPLAAVAEVRAPVDEEPASLPDPLPELIAGIGGELWSVAGRATDAGLGAVGDCMAAAARGASTGDGDTAPSVAPDSPPEVDLEAPLLALRATVEATEQVVVRIGLCLSAINALALAPDASGSPAEAAPEAQAMVDRLQDLFEELVVARERLGTKARELG